MTNPLSTTAKLAADFPGLQRVGRLGKTIPFIQQATAADCGAACLAMTLAYHGREVPLEEIRSTLGVGRDGATARAIVEAAAAYDLSARGVRVPLADLQHVPSGSILHWDFAHFVVFESASAGQVRIVDPALGRVSVPTAAASKAFTGVALLLEPLPAFAPHKSGDRPIARYLKLALSFSNDWHRIAVASIFLELLALLLPIIQGRLIDGIMPRNDRHLLVVLIAALATTLTFHFLGALVRSQLLLQLRTRFDAKLTFGFFEHLLRLPYGFFERRHAADLQLRVASVATVRDALTGAVLSGCIDGIMVASHSILLPLISMQLTLIALGVVSVQSIAYLAIPPEPEPVSRMFIVEGNVEQSDAVCGEGPGCPALAGRPVRVSLSAP